MGLLNAALIGGSVVSGLNSLLKSYLSDFPRTPYMSDYIDFFKLTPADFTLMISFAPGEDDKSTVPLLQLALIQGLSYQINKNVVPLTSIEAPFYGAISDGRIIGNGQISRLYTTPVEVPSYNESLETMFKRWAQPERMADSSFLLIIQKNENRPQRGEEVYKYFKENAEGGLLGDLKSFAKGLVKKAASNIMKSINSVLPIMETMALLSNLDLLGGYIEKNIEGSYIEGMPVSYSFSAAAGNVACIEAMSFIILDANFSDPKEVEG